ncbi:MAG: DUF433 domain-containing protein [Pirellulales bacterium]|nr:DUF433 domain-containing protein [Pirellulales bacterium]
MEPLLPQHIELTPGVRSGKPRIVGTRICVSDVVVWTEQGRSPEEIVNDFPQLSLADVHAALAYYHDHRQEIDRQLRASEEFADSLRASVHITLPHNPELSFFRNC